MSFQAFRDVLPSGLTVVTVETPHLHSAMCAVYARVGSRHETKATNGASHFLEHLFFRGSRGWPDSVRMNAAVEAIGGNLNGVTMRDTSYFYTPTHPGGVEVALRILGDMLSRPRLVHLKTEKSIILEEMLDEVDEQGRDIDVDNLSRAAMFGDHPLGLKIAGTPQTVKRMTLRTLQAHLKTYYVAGNLVVAVAGPVRHAQVLAIARKAFAHLPRGPRAAELPPEAAPNEGPYLHYVPQDEAQVEFRLSFPAVSDGHSDAVALGLLRRVLDDGLSSRLPYTIVEDRGLAYSVAAMIDALHDCGSFEVEGACAARHLGPAVAGILETLATLRRGEISRDEFRRVQLRFRMHLDFLQDSPGDLCGWFGGLELFRRPETFEEKCREAEALTIADLARVARRYLVPETLQVVAVGPRGGKKPLQKVVARAAKLLDVSAPASAPARRSRSRRRAPASP